MKLMEKNRLLEKFEKEKETKEIIIELTEKLLGTVPKNKNLYSDFVLKKMRDNNGKNEEELETVEDLQEQGWTGFHQDKNGIFLYDYQIKGFLKEAANTLKDFADTKALRSKIQKYVFVAPREIHLAEKPDGVFERPLRAHTAQGERITLTKSDYVEAGKKIQFEIILVPGRPKEVDWDLIEVLLKYGEFQALGQFRNGGFGRFRLLQIR